LYGDDVAREGILSLFGDTIGMNKRERLSGNTDVSPRMTFRVAGAGVVKMA
jgi:hypothetical protein